jgi:hypothetical protein
LSQSISGECKQYLTTTTQVRFLFRLRCQFDRFMLGSFTDESSDSGSPGPDEFTNPLPNGSSSVSGSPTISPNLNTPAQPKKNTQYPCRTCDRNFTREYTRKLHEKAHAARAEPLRCHEPNCNITFSRSHDRLRWATPWRSTPFYW